MLNKIGQLFVTGFDTASPSEEFLDFFGSEQLGGIILFEEQCNPHSSAEESIRSVVLASNTVPFIGVDQEGGRVCRFRGAPAEYGAPSEYGRRKQLDKFGEDFSRAAYYLHSLGINLIYGPVADLSINKANQCLEGRTFGPNPAGVIPFIEKAVKIGNKAGLLSCLKHFPGFGAAVNDPHSVLALADFDYQTFINREALTFMAGIGAGADMVMTTHLELPALDGRAATISEKIVKGLLRDKLGFDGIAITDDLLMKGADQFGGYGERAVKAFLAGHDLLLFGRDFKATREALQYFREACRRGEISDELLEISLDRISGIKSKLSVPVL